MRVDVLKPIIKELDHCGYHPCGKSLRTPGGIKGVKVGFRLFHEDCASQYQEMVEARERARQGPSWGTVTVLPDCLDTQGWFDWTHGAQNPESVHGSIYDRALARPHEFVWC